jgi:hypothetical protein
MRMSIVKKVLHALGISTIFAAFTLELLIFYDIAVYGHFHATETNPVILFPEIALACYGVAYVLIVFLFRWKEK